MEYLIQNRHPLSVFHFFEQICAIPHPSFHEEKIADYLVDFANKRSLSVLRDALGNVLIKKPATPDKEGHEPLLLQGHTDMVCEKNADVVHDFLRDPLHLFLEGDLLGARGTTLGGDDGIAVAIMLSILDGSLPSHPPIECLFTVSEEVGLEGAKGFDYSMVAAKKMLNLDSEDLGIITAGCAGGLRSDLILSYAPEKTSRPLLRITVKGLLGGHSGVDIGKGRANANKLMGRLLASLLKEGDIQIHSITGGSKDNAIPRECEAIVAVRDIASAKETLARLEKSLKREWNVTEPTLSMSASSVELESACIMPLAESAAAIALLSGAENGVKEMNQNVEGLVEWSRNLGVVRTEEGRITFVFSTRSSMESRLDASIDELDALAHVCGCTTRHHSRYPGWSYAPVSPLRDAYCKAYRSVTGKDAEINVIHAGLECGIIYSAIPEMDIISIGPDMRDIHSPNERLDLSSVEVFWKTLKAVIEML